MARAESLLARPPALSVGETLQKYYQYSSNINKWQRYTPSVVSPYYNRGSPMNQSSLGKNLLATSAQRPSSPSGPPTRSQHCQQYQILSTAKNIPRSALDNCTPSAGSNGTGNDIQSDAPKADCNKSKTTGGYKGCAEIVLLKYPPFIVDMDPHVAIPQIPFLVYKDDDLSDDCYATWLATQVKNVDLVKHLTGKPPHLKPMFPPSLKPSGKCSCTITVSSYKNVGCRCEQLSSQSARLECGR